MRVITLASSSKGNCILVYTDTTKILIDMGITIKELEQKLSLLDIAPTQIDAVINTHVHSDHIKGIAQLMRKYGVKCYSHIDGITFLKDKLNKIDQTNLIAFTSQSFYINDVLIDNIKIPHDAPCCVGYKINYKGKVVSYATDLGHYTDQIVEFFNGSKLVILESNYDRQTLINNPNYSAMLKQRIMSKKGHLSNVESGEIICKLAEFGVKQVILAHLSIENNSPEMAYDTISQILQKNGMSEGTNIKIDIAKPFDMGNLYKLS